MPRRPHQPGPADYAVLGLLAMAPRHGYELAAYLASGGELGIVCTLGLSNLYALLHALEELGLVRADRSAVSAGPPRKVYRLTRAGLGAFHAWLDRPVRRIREIRQDFLLKLFFSRRLPDHDTRALLGRQIAACRTHLAELEGAATQTPRNNFSGLVLSARKNAAEATIAWLVEQRRCLRSRRLSAAGEGDAA